MLVILRVDPGGHARSVRSRPGTGPGAASLQGRDDGAERGQVAVRGDQVGQAEPGVPGLQVVTDLRGAADVDGRHLPYRLDVDPVPAADRKSTRLNSSHVEISYAVFCLKKKKKKPRCRKIPNKPITTRPVKY